MINYEQLIENTIDELIKIINNIFHLKCVKNELKDKNELEQNDNIIDRKLSRRKNSEKNTTEKKAELTYTIIEQINNGDFLYSKPFMIFNYGKVYRNDVIDKTHLPYFYQLEVILLEKKNNNIPTNELLKNIKEAIEIYINKTGIDTVKVEDFPYSIENSTHDFNYNKCELGTLTLLKNNLIKNNLIKNNLIITIFDFGIERMIQARYNIDNIYDILNEKCCIKIIRNQDLKKFVIPASEIILEYEPIYSINNLIELNNKLNINFRHIIINAVLEKNKKIILKIIKECSKYDLKEIDKLCHDIKKNCLII
jgi:phenylalanyl-tRNA synthetase alpha subunit